MSRRDRGRQEYRGLFGSEPEADLAEILDRSPDMFDTLLDQFGGTFTRLELTRADRELATVAMLAALGDTAPQITAHVRGALAQGWAPSELRALCEHVVLYAGFPRGLNVLTAVDTALTAEGFPRPATLRRVTLEDHETTVAQRGESGPPVVLIHALGLDWRMWEPVMDRLAAGRRVFAYDVRGHGQAVGSPLDFTFADAARDLVTVLDALRLDKVHLVGLSMGGAIAQSVAVAAPERLASLALLATIDIPVPELFESRARAAEEEGMAAQIAPTLTRWFTPEALAGNGWGVRYAREHVLRSDPARWAAAWRAQQTLDTSGRLRSLSAPTLLLSGENDAAVPPEAMAAFANRIPGSTHAVLPAAPHLQPLECPEPVADALEEFLPGDSW